MSVIPVRFNAICHTTNLRRAAGKYCQKTWRNCNAMKTKKRSEETQTLRAGCSKAEPKIFTPPQTPFPGARDGQNLISWRRSLSLNTNSVWWGSMHAISTYRGNRPTNTQTQTDKPGHRQDRLQYTAPQLAIARSVNEKLASLTLFYCCTLFKLFMCQSSLRAARTQ